MEDRRRGKGLGMKPAFAALFAASALVPLFLLSGALSSVGSSVPSAQAGRRGIDDELTDEQERILSGYSSFTLGSNAENGGNDPQSPRTYFPRGSDSCPNNLQSNIKVNQNCLNLSDPDLQGRGQAQNEEFIKVDPNNTNHVVASYNDYRRGDGTCGVSYSSDGGRTWNDTTVPNNFTRNPTAGFGPRTYWQGGGDTSVAFD